MHCLSMLMMLMFWEEMYIVQRKLQNQWKLDIKEIGLEVNGDETEYMVMSGDENAGWIESINLKKKNPLSINSIYSL